MWYLFVQVRKAKSTQYLVGVLAAAVLAVCVLPSCQNMPDQTRGTDIRPPKPVSESNIVYVVRGDTELLLDLERPAEGDGPFPAVVFIHDGGWLEGAKSDVRIESVLAARRGYVGVAIDYRLTRPLSEAKPENQFPAQIHDVKAAIRWLRANAEKYNIDPERIGVVGYGAGGQLALLAAFTEPKDGLEG